jgi:hypothetical protein
MKASGDREERFFGYIVLFLGTDDAVAGLHGEIE